jgi:GT2 family glycosyltransferase
MTVSYNTRELTAFLLRSPRTIVSWPELEIVVVDNGSRDGSAPRRGSTRRRWSATRRSASLRVGEIGLPVRHGV